MSDDVIDHYARATAEAAVRSVETHERHCGERWEQARKAHDETNTSLKEGFATANLSAAGLHKRIDKIVWASGVGAIGLLGNIGLMLVRGG